VPLVTPYAGPALDVTSLGRIVKPDLEGGNDGVLGKNGMGTVLTPRALKLYVDAGSAFSLRRIVPSRPMKLGKEYSVSDS